MTETARRRVYRAALLLLPAVSRRSLGESIVEAYEQMWRDEVEAGRLSRVRFWSGLLRDVGATAVAEWWSRPTAQLGRGGGMGGIVRDLGYGLRQLTRQPVLSAAVIALVAIGIGGNMAVFRVLNGLFLQPLPFDEASSLVDLDLTAPDWNLDFVGVSIGEYRYWTEAEPRSLTEVTVYDLNGANLAFPDGAERVSVLLATHSIDEVLRIQPTLGRFFTEAEDQPDGERVALLTHRYWTERYAGDRAIVGSNLVLDGEVVSVIGVLPAAADFVAEADLWVPLQEDNESSFYLTGIARLSDGITPEAAQAELRDLRVSGVDAGLLSASTDPVVASLRDRYLGDGRLGGGVLFGAMVMVLLVACANIAGLMIARSMARSSEVSVRRALGAGRGRLIQQLFAESLVLALVGGAVGTLVGFWASGWLVAIIAEGAPTWVTFRPDPALFVFTVVATLGSAVLFGLLPAIRASRVRWDGVRGGTSSRSRRRGLRALVMAQVALAVMLLVGSGLAVSDVRSLTRIDPGYDHADLLTWQIQPSATRYPDADAQRTFVREYQRVLAETPGVEAAVVANVLPLAGHSGWFFQVEGAPPDADAPAEVVLRRLVTPGYIDAMGVDLIAGRALLDSDSRDSASLVTVVNEAFVASHLVPEVDPVGQRIRLGDGAPWIEVVGVARNVMHYGVDQPMRPAIYEPYSANPGLGLRVAVRVRDGAEAFDAVRRATAEVDPSLALFDVRTMESRMDLALLPRRAAAWLLLTFSIVAVLLCVAGLYGVISFDVAERRREIGIRMALGAQSWTVGRRVAIEGVAVASVGVVAGLAFAAVGARLAASALASVTVWDPTIYVGVGATVLLVAAAANWFPAARAARTNPADSLRQE